MKKIKLILILAGIFIFTISCNKNLELSPISTISTKTFWKSEDDANGAKRGMYVRFREVTATNLYLWGESRSSNLKQSVGNDFANIRNFDNTLDPTAAGPDWTSVYRVVNDANLILKYVPDIPFKNENDKSRILAEAYAMRAFCYYIMVRTWGELPLVLEPTEGFNPDKLYKERSSVASVFDQIKKDIQLSIDLFTDNSFVKGRGYWSKPAASALKGDVFLWTGKKLGGGTADLTVALNAFEEVEKADVQLLDDFSSIFSYNNKGNKEVIFANSFVIRESPSTFFSNMFIDTYPPNVDPVQSSDIGVVGGANYWTLTDQTRDAFLNDDQRKAATFTELYSKDNATGQYTKFYGCIQRKFDGIVESGVRYFVDDVIIYRFADILLLKAETQNALNQDPSDAINKLRKRAFKDKFQTYAFVSSTKENNDREILKERLVELLYEGKFWWDVVRFGMVSDYVPYFKVNPTHTYKYLWPLSLKILSSEPKVKQNPGYNP